MLDFDNINKRFNWAKARHDSFRRSVDFFKRSHPLLSKSNIVEDRMSWEVVAAIDKPPPLVE